MVLALLALGQIGVVRFGPDATRVAKIASLESEGVLDRRYDASNAQILTYSRVKDQLVLRVHDLTGKPLFTAETGDQKYLSYSRLFQYRGKVSVLTGVKGVGFQLFVLDKATRKFHVDTQYAESSNVDFCALVAPNMTARRRKILLDTHYPWLPNMPGRGEPHGSPAPFEVQMRYFPAAIGQIWNSDFSFSSDETIAAYAGNNRMYLWQKQARGWQEARVTVPGSTINAVGKFAQATKDGAIFGYELPSGKFQVIVVSLAKGSAIVKSKADGELAPDLVTVGD